MSRIRSAGMVAAIGVGVAIALSSQAGEAPAPVGVSESAPGKTKEPPTASKATDSKKQPNPKTPASVSESAPDKSADADKKGMKKKSEAKP